MNIDRALVQAALDALDRLPVSVPYDDDIDAIVDDLRAALEADAQQSANGQPPSGETL